MAKKKNEITETTAIVTDPSTPKPRLVKLIIKNFRCIGSTPVTIDLNEIVVLVGPNNTGKSSILRAYEVAMSEGSKEAELTIEDFPSGKIEEGKFPEIELHTIVYDNSPGENWLLLQPNGENHVKEKCTWKAPGKPQRQGFHKDKQDWDDARPWGAPNVANSRRPEPHRIDAFAKPEEQTSQIISILKAVIEGRVKSFKNPQSENTEEVSPFDKLLLSIKEIQKTIVAESEAEISKVQKELTEEVSKVFPNYEIKFDAKAEDELEKTISLFKANPQLLMGHKDGYLSSVELQGSGARRTLLWTALKIISENKSKQNNNTRTHILLIDEPEICLHPTAIRDACNVLYNLPSTGNWQVMVTTHSPIFVDFSRDNTTIVRVDKNSVGDIESTTVFRPDTVRLDVDDKKNLKMLNLCDPYVAEFFFGGKSIIVEGDTEYTAFKHIIAKKPEDYRDVHIIRARGKATIISLVKILNHFGSNYSVLHDTDTPKIQTKNGEQTNGAWTTNQNILDAINSKPIANKVRLLASLPNFEKAYFDEEVKNEKPYNALQTLETSPTLFAKVEKLHKALIDHEAALPDNCIEWSSLVELENNVNSLAL